MIAKCLNYPTISDPPSLALLNHTLKLAPKRLKTLESLANVLQLFSSNRICCLARLIRPVRQTYQVSDGLQREAKFPCMADETELLYSRVVVKSLISF
jgi:hypothetical protein